MIYAHRKIRICLLEYADKFHDIRASAKMTRLRKVSIIKYMA